jgi:hypothetical protein
MAQENIIYKSIYNFIYNFSDYNNIRNNEERLITIINKKSFNLKNNIKYYINLYYYNNININNIFRDKYIKKLIKNQIIYDEMLILIEKKNKEIEELKMKLQK